MATQPQEQRGAASGGITSHADTPGFAKIGAAISATAERVSHAAQGAMDAAAHALGGPLPVAGTTAGLKGHTTPSDMPRTEAEQRQEEGCENTQAPPAFTPGPPASAGVNAGLRFQSAATQDVLLGAVGGPEDDPRAPRARIAIVGASPVESGRGGDPSVYTPIPGGPATTIRDSGQMVNTGPSPDSARSQGFGLTHQPGDGGGALSALANTITSFVGDAFDASIGGDRASAAEPYPAGDGAEEERRRNEELKAAMVGMPGSMPIDQEIREMREAQLEERLAQRAAAKAESDAAAREALAGNPAAREYMVAPPGLDGSDAATHAASVASDRASEGSSVGGGGLLSSLAEKVSHALGLGDTGPMATDEERGGGRGGVRDEVEAGRGHTAEGYGSDLARKPVPAGTSPLEAKPYDQTAIGVPAAAERNADRSSGGLNTKEAGQAVPSGALGAVAVGDTSSHVQPYAPDMAKPNFFQEVEKRGLGQVLGGMVSGVVRSVEHAAENVAHGGEPAPWSVTSGAVSDTSMITRNVERADHLDDPTQAKIYEAEVVKTRPGSLIQPHQTSREEKEREATHGMVLGMNKPVSGAVPHGKPGPDERGQPVATDTPPKTAAARGIYGSIGTGSAASATGSREVKDATMAFMETDSGCMDVRSAPAPAHGPHPRPHMAKALGASSAEERAGRTSLLARLAALFEAKAAGPDDEQRAREGLPPGAAGSGLPGTPPPSERAAAAHGLGNPKGPYDQNTPDPTGYAEGKVHSGAMMTGARPKEPSGKEVKDAQYLKIYEDPHSHNKHIMGANFNWDRNKDREEPQATTATDNPTIFDQLGRRVHHAVTGELPEGVPPAGIDTPGGTVNAGLDVVDRAKDMAAHAPELVSDVASRTEQTLIGVAEHTQQALESAAHVAGNVLRSGLSDVRSADERMEEARRLQDEREQVYEQDMTPGVWGEQIQRNIERKLAAGEAPAQQRETLLDKILYPWTKDASDDTHAREVAASYKQYTQEKAAAGTPYDPLGAMQHDKEYDTSKLPSTTAAMDRSRVNLATGERSGNNQEWVARRAAESGHGNIPASARAAVEGLQEDLERHGRTVTAGLAGTVERFKEMDLKDQQQQAGQQATAAGQRAAASVAGAVQAASDTATDTARGVSQAASDTAQRTAQGVGRAVGNAAEATRSGADAVESNVHDAAGAAREGAAGAHETATSVFDKARDAIKSLLGGGGHAPASGVAHPTHETREVAHEAWRQIGPHEGQGPGGEEREPVSDAVRRRMEEAKQAGHEAVARMQAPAGEEEYQGARERQRVHGSSPMDTLAHQAGRVAGQVTSALDKVFGGASETARGITEDTRRGIDEMRESAHDAAADARGRMAGETDSEREARLREAEARVPPTDLTTSTAELLAMQQQGQATATSG